MSLLLHVIAEARQTTSGTSAWQCKPRRDGIKIDVSAASATEPPPPEASDADADAVAEQKRYEQRLQG